MQDALHDGKFVVGRDVMTPPSTVHCVQWLRFFAAALVVLYHSELQIMRLDHTAVHRFGIGAAGVDLFFVISGFIMVHTTQRRDMTFNTFMQRRLIRIVPLYWIFTGLLVFLISVRPSLFRSSLLDSVHLLTSLSFLPYPHPVSGELRPLLVLGWTLNAEMFFYLCFGATLSLTLEQRVVALTLFFLALVGLAQMIDMPSHFLSFYGAPLMLEFVGGMAIAWVMMRYKVSGTVVAMLCCAGLFLTGLGIQNGISEHPARVIYWGVAATCLLFSCVWYERVRGWPKLSLLTKLGDASYAIYLSHLFVLGLAGPLIASLGLFNAIGANGTRIILLTSACVVGLAVHDYLEKPMLTFFGRNGQKPRPLLK